MSINERRGMRVNLELSGLAKDAADLLRTMTDAPLEDIVSTALVNEAELRLHELGGGKVYVGTKRRRRKLKRLEMLPINIPNETPPPTSNVIFLRKRGKPTA